MNRLQTASLITARVLLALVFLLNGLGIVDQSEALRELIGRGAPVSIAPTLLWIARAVEVIAGEVRIAKIATDAAFEHRADVEPTQVHARER